MMARIAETGPFAGNAIRQARKSYGCDNWHWTRPDDCPNAIEPGDFYVEGDTNIDRAGGFGRDRICLTCAKVGVPA